MKHLSLILCLLVAGACGDDVTDPPGANNPSAPRGLALGADFNSGVGVLTRIVIATREVSQNLLPNALSSDMQLRVHAGRVFLLDRIQQNLTELDAHTLAVKSQRSTGAQSNPQDVAVYGDRLYVPALGSKGVLVFDGEASAPRVLDLSDLDGNGPDGDGLPDCNAAIVVGERLLVSCGWLDAAWTSQAGKLVVIDLATETIAQVLTLTRANPFSRLYVTPTSSAFAGDLLIGMVPDPYQPAQGCILRIELGTTVRERGCAFSNAELGGYATDFVAHDTDLYVVVPKWMGAAPLRRISLVTGLLDATPATGANTQIHAAAVCIDGTLLASDLMMGNQGVRMYQQSKEVTSVALELGLPPAGGGALACIE